MAKRNIFNRVPVRKVKRSSFDLSHKVLTTMDMMKLYPVGTPIQCIPGDKIKLGHQVIAHLNPMGSPTFADISMYFMDFFVSYRNIYPDKDEHLFERFISNEKLDNGDTPVLPRMNATDHTELANVNYSNYNSVWDYFGFQTGVKPAGLSAPLDAPFRAYKFIWNEYFRDEHLQDELDISDMSDLTAPLDVNYGRDYFTSASLEPQQGDEVALPLAGFAPVYANVDELGDWDNNGVIVNSINGRYPLKITGRQDLYQYTISGSPVYGKKGEISADPVVDGGGVKFDSTINTGNQTAHVHREQEAVYQADLSEVSAMSIKDLRLSNALQRWKEINIKCGTRYTEFLRAQYGVYPRDERLQRPEYIGGTKAPVIVSQVLQTSNAKSTGQETPTGYKYGQGMIASSEYSGTYHVKEFGMIISLAFIRPKTLYQDGISREWTPETYLDFMNPLYVGLGQQGIKNGEVFAVNDEEINRKIWGYQDMYQEYRYRPDRVTGKMRSNITGDMANSFDYWHLGRHFNSLPQLNENFIKGDSSTLNRIFQAGNTEVQFLCEVGNIVKAVRPLPYYAIPKL